MSIARFLEDNKSLKYIFFGGKGGVGKTVLAGAASLRLSGQGRRVLLASTNPVHSLSGMLGMDVLGRPKQIPGYPNLYALEIDTKDSIKKKKEEIKEKIEWFLRFADIPTKVDEFIEVATMNPAFEESAMFEEMVDIIFKDEYEIYVFDTAPTANTRRLLGMSSVYKLWVEKMLKSKEEAAKLKKALSYSKKEGEDVLSDYLVRLRDRIDRVHKILTDSELTTFFFVTLAEALPIAVIKRFINWFKEFGIPVGGVLVNGIIPKEVVEESSPDFVLNRLESQERYLKEIFSSFDNVLAIVPLMDQEVKAVEMLEALSERLFNGGDILCHQ